MTGVHLKNSRYRISNASGINDENRRERFLIVTFIVSCALVILVPAVGPLIKFSVLPISLIALYRFDSFNYLLFPLTFLDNAMGTFLFGKFTLMLFYIAILLFKLITSGKRMPDLREMAFATVCVLFFVYAYGEYGNNSIKMIIIILCMMIVGNKIKDDPRRLENLLFTVYTSSLLPALSFTFGLSGTYKTTDRMAGLGYSDPNYASFICTQGLCALLNTKFKTKIGKVFQYLSVILIFVGIFRSGSRSGLLVAVSILLMKVVFTQGVGKKMRIIVFSLAVAILILFIISNVIEIPYMEELLWRWERTFSSIESQDYTLATVNRSDIANAYMNHFANQSLLKQAFGFNIPGSPGLVAVAADQVTHNVYIDFLMAFGVIGTIYIFFQFISRCMWYFRQYKDTSNPNFLTVFEMKLSMAIFGTSLAMLQVYSWWFVFLI